MIIVRHGSWRLFIRGTASVLLLLEFTVEAGFAQNAPVVKPIACLTNSAAVDQDDACFWRHPNDSSRSLIITSDKSGNQVFVYDLNGNLEQTIPVPKPGNIDIRQSVPVDGELIDLVVVNQRAEGFALVVFKVNVTTRMLERIDMNCSTDPNYGGCLFLSQKTQRLYNFCTSENGTIIQYELKPNSVRRITATKVRTLTAGKCEGAVADDARSELYIADEATGVWKFPAEPDESSTGILVAAVGENGLKGDVEGLSIHKLKNGSSGLVVSDQGSSRFAVYDRDSAHQLIGTFQIEGVGATDGIDSLPVNLQPQFPGGIFACHNGLNPGTLTLTSWEAIETALLP